MCRNAIRILPTTLLLLRSSKRRVSLRHDGRPNLSTHFQYYYYPVDFRLRAQWKTYHWLHVFRRTPDESRVVKFLQSFIVGIFFFVLMFVHAVLGRKLAMTVNIEDGYWYNFKSSWYLWSSFIKNIIECIDNILIIIRKSEKNGKLTAAIFQRNRF